MSRPVTRFPHDGCRFLAARRTLLRNLCRQNVVMLEVVVFTASEKRLPDLVVSFSGLR
jgi:hypothetical protein